MSDSASLTYSLGWHVEVFLGIAILALTAAGLVGSGLKSGFEFSRWNQLLVAFNIVMGVWALLSGVQKYRRQLDRIREQMPEVEQ